MKILKRFTCKHKWVLFESYLETGENGHKYLKHTWKCAKCGKVE